MEILENKMTMNVTLLIDVILFILSDVSSFSAKSYRTKALLVLAEWWLWNETWWNKTVVKWAICTSVLLSACWCGGWWCGCGELATIKFVDGARWGLVHKLRNAWCVLITLKPFNILSVIPNYTKTLSGTKTFLIFELF